MASLKLCHIYKVYDNGHKAVNDFNIDIKDKEFIVFVGPSGCGKSTTLRMISGLEKITSGDLFIGDTLVNDMEPKDRDIAMVFQNYALYPHMSVYENMAFGLRNRKMPEAEIKEKVMEAARILDIEEYLDRKPSAMSGGQRQRVALGRAIVRNPKVFLLDEPLSNLDAKLRAQMRTEITKLHQKLATTFIYVTHDQVEAMTMGTRIVVMKLGYVQQIDTPMNLYNKPYNKFVAGFIGTPQMNFFDVKLLRNKDKVEISMINDAKFDISYETISVIKDSYLYGKQDVILGIRPEHISIVKEKTGLSAVVNAVEHLGNESIIYGNIGTEVSDEYTMKEAGSKIVIKVIGDSSIAVGDVINFKIDETKLHLFDKESEVTLLEAIPSYSVFEGEVKSEKLNLLGSSVRIAPRVRDMIGEAKKLTLHIPPNAIIPGKDFSLKVAKVVDVEGQKLAYLQAGDKYLFALVGDGVKPGDKYSFNLLNDKIDYLDGDEVKLSAIKPNEEFIGKFAKKELKRNEIEFSYIVNGVSFSAPNTCGYKINAIEGNKCYKKDYRLVFNRKAISLVSEGIKGVVKEVYDYINQKYALVDFDGQELVIEVAPDFADSEVSISVPGEAIEIWQQENDFRIC